MKNIVFFTHSMAKSGGIERVTANLANMWIDAGFDVEIVVVGPDTSSFFYLKKKIRVVSLNLDMYTNKLQGAIWFCKMIYRFRGYLKKGCPDIIFGIWTSRAVCAIISSLFMDVPVVACEHIAFHELRKGLRIMRKIFYPYANAIVSLTDDDARLYQRLNKMTYTIPNAITSNVLEYHMGGTNTVLAVGRLAPQKGFDLLLKAWRVISVKHPLWKLKIIGRKEFNYDEYALMLYKYVEGNNLFDSVIFQGETTDIISEYDNADIFVLPSRFEGLPMVLLEAMSRALPVVSFNCPTGPKDIITNEVDGLLVPNGEIEKLAKSMETLMDNYQIRKRLGENASKKISSSYSNGAIYDKWSKLIDEVMA